MPGGSTGVWIPAKKFQSYCGGEYSGHFLIDGTSRHFTYGTTKHNLYGAAISAVSISKVHTTGARTCPG